MAKRKRKAEFTAEEMEVIETARLAAHEVDEARELIETIIETEQDNEEVQEDSEAHENSDEGAEMDAPAVEDAGEDEAERVVNTVVHEKYKQKYTANAIAAGVSGKAAKRSNWDWLSQQIASYCLDEKHKIDIERFTELLDVNGVDHSKWTNRNQGWEGRFRMTGRVVLQKVVANMGHLHLPDGEDVAAPDEFVEKYKTKA